MAFEIKDFYMGYTKKGSILGIFNVAREDYTNDVVQYFAYFNDEGSYVIQRSTTDATTTVRIWGYYGRGNKPDGFATDWSNRSTLAYVEYHALFQQS